MREADREAAIVGAPHPPRDLVQGPGVWGSPTLWPWPSAELLQQLITTDACLYFTDVALKRKLTLDPIHLWFYA